MKPHIPDDFDDEQLVRYLSGECSAEEAQVIARWIDASPERQREVDLLRRGWDAAGEPVERGDVDRGWAAMAERLDEPAMPTAGRRVPRVLRLEPVLASRSRWVAPLRVAAAILLLGAGGWLVRLVEQGRRASVAEQAGAVREIATGPGQRAEVRLSDGTHVILGVASRLRFPTSFGASRDVELEGQAFFTVVHDAVKPFAVRTKRAVARDLGTKFDVRAYGDTEEVAVVVTEGAVSLAPTNQRETPREMSADSVLLGPSDLGRVTRDGRVTAARGIDVDAHLSWMRGRLVFRQMPVPEAVAQFNRWYAADVQVGDSALARLAITASLGNESLSQALDILAGALDARLERRGETIILYATHDNR